LITNIAFTLSRDSTRFTGSRGTRCKLAQPDL
jgi:hypothetical protein